MPIARQIESWVEYFRNRTKAIRIASAVFLTGSCSAAFADGPTTTLPPSVASIYLDLDYYSTPSFQLSAGGSADFIKVTGASPLVPSTLLPTSVNAFSVGKPAGAVLAAAEIGGPVWPYFPLWADSKAFLVYYLSVQGPQNVTVPLDVSGALSATAPTLPEPDGGAIASVTIGTLFQDCVAAGLSMCPGESLSYYPTVSYSRFSGPINVMSDTPIMVTLNAESWIQPFGDAIAYADPVFNIDPTFAQANQFSIVLSDGIGNSLAAPGPTPGAGLLSLAFLGFLGASAAWRERQRSIS